MLAGPVSMVSIRNIARIVVTASVAIFTICGAQVQSANESVIAIVCSTAYGKPGPDRVIVDASFVRQDHSDAAGLVRLGRTLFFDQDLSADRTISCASCHQPGHGWSSPDKYARGVGDQLGKRHALSLYNVGTRRLLFWDGRENTLEEMVLLPVHDLHEMNQSSASLVERLERLPEYREMFSAANVGLDEAGVGQALAAFCRTIVATDALLDRYRAGDTAALSPAAKRGHDLFYFRLNCASCHTGSQLTDGKFHNLGIGMDQDDPDLGRFVVTGKNEDRGAFRTPSLRNLSKTAPYMHDGRFQTLQEVIDFYKQGGHYNSHLDPLINLLPLEDEEGEDLVAFLTEGLTSASDPAAEAAAASELNE